MNSEISTETFFCIGPDRLSLSVFEDADKKIFEKQLLIDDNLKKQDFDSLIDKFFGENIKIIEKKAGRFINEINLISYDLNFVLIQASIKKKRADNKIDQRELNKMLFDIKQQIKENNIDKTITHMKIKSFLLDNKQHLNLDDNFECNELCLQIDFICLPNNIISDLSKKIKKYQVSVQKIFSAKYLKEYHNGFNENECQIAARLKYEMDENEVHLIKKTMKKPGFFERFFRFFG